MKENGESASRKSESFEKNSVTEVGSKKEVRMARMNIWQAKHGKGQEQN
jgi:hypothetical protein